jgi:MFS family permease
MVLVLGIASQPLGGIIVSRLGTKGTLQLGLTLNAIACLCFALGHGSLEQAAFGTLLLGIGGGLPHAAVFNRAAALYPARAGGAIGFVNMLGVFMILTATPLVGQLVVWMKTFQSSFLALSVFALLALISSAAIHQHEPPAIN